MSVSLVRHKYSLLFLYPVFDVYIMSFFRPKMYSLETKLKVLKIMVMHPVFHILIFYLYSTSFHFYVCLRRLMYETKRFVI